MELEAWLLNEHKRKPELLSLLQAREQQVPDQIGLVADLLSRYGFAKEAESGYKASVAHNPMTRADSRLGPVPGSSESSR